MQQMQMRGVVMSLCLPEAGKKVKRAARTQLIRMHPDTRVNAFFTLS
jgi:hypothetical protein